jgi:hypothetical protein
MLDRPKLCLLVCLSYLALAKPCCSADRVFGPANTVNPSPRSQPVDLTMLEGEKRPVRFEAYVTGHNQFPSSEEVRYIGNCVSGKFHRPWCPFEQVMNCHKAVFFRFRREAFESGFIPCRYCLPPIVKRVRCVLLKGCPKEGAN